MNAEAARRYRKRQRERLATLTAAAGASGVSPVSPGAQLSSPGNGLMMPGFGLVGSPSGHAAAQSWLPPPAAMPATNGGGTDSPIAGGSARQSLVSGSPWLTAAAAAVSATAGGVPIASPVTSGFAMMSQLPGGPVYQPPWSIFPPQQAGRGQGGAAAGSEASSGTCSKCGGASLGGALAATREAIARSRVAASEARVAALEAELGAARADLDSARAALLALSSEAMRSS
eukprot:tig00001487_g8943.t1